MRSRGEGCLVAWLLGVCLRKFLEPAAIGDPKLFCQASRSDFNPALVESQSKAAKFVCNWLRALSGYDEARPHSIHVSCYRGTSGPRTLFKLEVYRSTAGLRDRASQMESEAALTRGLVTERQAGLRNMRRLCCQISLKKASSERGRAAEPPGKGTVSPAGRCGDVGVNTACAHHICKRFQRQNGQLRCSRRRRPHCPSANFAMQ